MSKKYPTPMKYTPKNPQKYKGDSTKIIARSSWELKFMKFCDFRESVVQWSSEEIIIPYKSPLDGRYHRYFPDFHVKIKNKEGKIENWLIEIKPKAQTMEPKIQKRKTKRYIQEVATYAVNKYKWEAAREYCADRQWKFVIFTEDHLF